jgi:hypothetical protein
METKQTGGTHYEEKSIQPFAYIKANELDFFEGNVIKYTTRHKSKNGVEDIQKAIDYLTYMKINYRALYNG